MPLWLRWILYVAVVASACTALAQNNTCITTVQVTPYTLVDGRMVPADPGEIQVKVARKPVRVLSVEPQHQPVRAVFVLDASGSMQSYNYLNKGDNGKWETVLQMAMRIADGTPAGSEFGLLAFSGKDTWMVPLTRDKAALLKAVDGLQRFPSKEHATTPLWYATEKARLMLQPKSQRDLLILLTDGGENANSSSYDALQRNLTNSGVRVLTVAFVDNNPRTEEERSGAVELRFLSERNGGLSIDLSLDTLRGKKVDQIEAAFAAAAVTVSNLIASSYEVKIERNDSAQKVQGLSIETKAKKVHLTYPHMIPPCATP